MRVANLILAWLKWGCLTLATGSLLITGILIWLAEPVHHKALRAPPKKEMTRIDKPLLVERKGDRLIWKLRAETAKQNSDGNLEMKHPELDLFTAAAVEIIIQSRHAFVDTVKKTVQFRNRVIVDYNGWKLRSELLVYDMNHDLIRVPEEFDLTGPAITARGKNMTIDRNSQHLLVKERVLIRDNRGISWSGRQ